MKKIKQHMEKHIKKLKNLFEDYCYIQSDNNLEEYEVQCTIAKVKEQYVEESNNSHKLELIFHILVSDLKVAKNLMDETLSQCPIDDFTNYKIQYKGNTYVVYKVAQNGSFDNAREIYGRLVNV
jgi:hypothetical protein|nr:MAG TPA: hypothetical protein [Bacteriophage sp.]